MRTANDCLVCFLRQALATVRQSTADVAEQWRITAEVGGMLARFDPALSPPENAVHYYRFIAGQTGVSDPYASQKHESNTFALGLEAQARSVIQTAADPLLAAILFAINANVLDYGAQYQLDRNSALASCQQSPLSIDHYQAFARQVAKRPTILYLADNCGEIVFDKLLIEQLLGLGCKVTVAVRQSPIINDATPEDAKFCGLDRLCPVIANGADVPGTSLSLCSTPFRQAFAAADCIVSKGMGNFECLSEVAAPLFFLFIIKCTTVLNALQRRHNNPALRIGSPILLQSSVGWSR